MEKKTLQVNADLADEGKQGMSRRGFVGGMGMMMAAAAMAAAGCSSSSAGAGSATSGSATSTTTVSSLTGWAGTPEDVLALGISTMPLEDLNDYRQRYIDAQVEYTMEDGTVVPLVYVQMRALVNSYGIGAGDEPYDTAYTHLMGLFTEEQVQGYLDMPRGVEFSAYDFSSESDHELEECEELCDLFEGQGYLFAREADRGRVYHQVAYFQGAAEYGYTRFMEDPTSPTLLGNITPNMANTGTPTFYYVPVDKSVTKEGELLPFDDVKAKLAEQDVLCISPCACRYPALITAYGLDAVGTTIPSMEDFRTGEYEDYFSDLCDQRVETCIQAGDEATYWIEHGWGRQITAEQAVEYLERSVEDGFMLESTFGKNSETICSCHIDSCGILGMWSAIGEAEDIAGCDAFKQVSHYTLEVDEDKCIGCGTCVDRCPLHIISINDDGWAEPGVNCMRCGQCAYVCPQEARKLTQRDADMLAPLPQGMLEDANVKAAYRFETGLLSV